MTGDLRPGHGLARIADEEHEEVVFLAADPQFDAFAQDAMARNVDDQVLDPDDVPLARFGAAEHGPHSGEQLGQPERLGHVVVRTGVEADDHVDLLGSGGEYEYRKVPPVGPRLAGHVEAVYVGKAEVEYDDVDPALHGLQGVTACFGELDIVALASQSAKERT